MFDTEPENMFLVHPDDRDCFGYSTVLIDFANVGVGRGGTELPNYIYRSVTSEIMRSSMNEFVDVYQRTPVSYTHLTLPTIYSV